MNVDFGRTASDYGQHRPGFPDELFERLAKLGIGDQGQRVLDLGTGTGHFGRGLALRGCEVVGLDPSESLIAEAKRLDEEVNVRIDYVVGHAERTMLDEKSFDVVAAGQCWRWFEHNKAIREIKRVVRPGGRLVIAQFDWLPLPGNAVEATERLIEKYNSEWNLGGGTGLHADALTDVRQAGFTAVETFSFDVDVSFSAEAWRGRVRASAGVKASMSPDMVSRFDEKLRRTLEDDFEEPLSIPHCAWALACRAPG